MSFRLRLRELIDVILRVPPLFLIDELLRIGLGLPYQTENEISLDIDNSTVSDGTSRLLEEIGGVGASYDAQFYAFLMITALKFAASCIGKHSSFV